MSLAKKYIQKQLLMLSKCRSHVDFRTGDTIKVYNKVIDENSERIQMFEGVCIAKTNNNLGSTFRVKKISYGMCFEKVFPLYSPLIQKIDVIKKGKVRRAKLYFMRDLIGKSARIKERKSSN